MYNEEKCSPAGYCAPMLDDSPPVRIAISSLKAYLSEAHKALSELEGSLIYVSRVEPESDGACTPYPQSLSSLHSEVIDSSESVNSLIARIHNIRNRLTV